MHHTQQQSVIFLHSDDYYHKMLDLFLLNARVNHNSFFELRVQKSILRHKVSDTERPGTEFSLGPVFPFPPPMLRPTTVVEDPATATTTGTPSPSLPCPQPIAAAAATDLEEENNTQLATVATSHMSTPMIN